MSLFVAEDDNEEVVVQLNQELETQHATVAAEHAAVHAADQVIDTRSAPVDISLSLPLKFQQRIVDDLVSEDGLAVLGKGLGTEAIAANLLHALSAPSMHNTNSTKRSLVVLLNALDDENAKIGTELMELAWLDAFADLDELATDAVKRPFIVVGGDTATVEKRRRLYTTGGIVSITSRVFVVDLLSGIVDPNTVTGIVLLHAERVKDTSNEAFVLTLYREKNDWGFVKALSDDPDAFTRGFQPLYNKLKSLRLRKCFLWPRFHIEVTSSLRPRAARRQRGDARRTDLRSTVTEINVEMSDSMKHIQIAILGCIEACVSELRRHNPTVATEYWAAANALDTDFVRTLRGTLDPLWHRVSWTTKQLVHDLATLKELLAKLLAYDSIGFYETVQQIFEANRPQVNVFKTSQSPWLVLDEAVTIHTHARKRVFDRADGGHGTYRLEEQPKWEQLCLVLADIEQERAAQHDADGGPVLVMCTDGAVCRQLRHVIASAAKTGHSSYSARRFMVQKLQEHLVWKDALTSATQQIQAQMLQNQQRAQMLQKAQHQDAINPSKTFMRGKPPPGKRRRTRGAAAVAAVGRLHSADVQKRTEDVDSEVVEQLRREIVDDAVAEAADAGDADADADGGAGAGAGAFDYGDALDDDIVVTSHDYNYIDRRNLVVIERYDSKTDDVLLQELMPSYIVMYDPDLAFIRRVEVYQAVNRDNPARVFFMYYGTSVEEQIHLSHIKKEKETFTRLIRENGQLAATYSTAEDNSRMPTRKSQVYNTRIAGGGFKDAAKETSVVVDIREFSGSALPNLLHRIGITVLPCMLTVGDYIISPKICVERKAIPDLIQSFKSGRLYTQCEQMFRHYELPTLLIEFDENKSFSLEPFAELRSKNNTNNNLTSAGAATDPVSSKLLQQDIQSKLMVLLIAFPKLKIIWSSSPYQTAQIILELKARQEEPDVNTAVGIGVDDMDDSVDGPPRYNEPLIDLLQNIPGINNVNYHLVIQKVQNLRELVTMPEADLAEIIGKEPAAKAYQFMHRSVVGQ